jgi:hypothetical protein
MKQHVELKQGVPQPVASKRAERISFVGSENPVYDCVLRNGSAQGFLRPTRQILVHFDDAVQSFGRLAYHNHIHRDAYPWGQNQRCQASTGLYCATVARAVYDPKVLD